MKLYGTKVYIAAVDGLSYEALYSAASARRRAQADALRFAEDKLRCLAAEALLRHCLKELGIERFCVTKDANGKPCLQDLPVHFNLSHSGSFVLCAVSEQAVGCDIQKVKAADLRLARRYFAPGEMRLLEDTPELFCRLWVLKESLGKALGCGLNESILGREFDLKEENPSLKDGPELHFREFSLPGYRCAVCSQTENISDLLTVEL